MGQNQAQSQAILQRRAWNLAWCQWPSPCRPSGFVSPRGRSAGASLRPGRCCRRRGWVELSKARRRPHVLATTQLDRGPFGKGAARSEEQERRGGVGVAGRGSAPESSTASHTRSELAEAHKGIWVVWIEFRFPMRGEPAAEGRAEPGNYRWRKSKKSRVGGSSAVIQGRVFASVGRWKAGAMGALWSRSSCPMTPRFVFGLQNTAAMKENDARLCHSGGRGWRLMEETDAAERGQQQQQQLLWGLWFVCLFFWGGMSYRFIKKLRRKNQRTPRLGIPSRAKRSRETQ